jgi:hypothetical protein
MPCLFTAGLLSWALSIAKGKYRNIRFSQKVLTRFLIKKICLESAWHWLSILLKTFFVKLPFSSLN